MKFAKNKLADPAAPGLEPLFLAFSIHHHKTVGVLEAFPGTMKRRVIPLLINPIDFKALDFTNS